jgi:trehalose 6-phosphate phosphatase
MAEPLRSPEALAPLLEAARLGVLTDFDGTIAAIAMRPEGAVVSPVAREALASLAQRLPMVGAMSGRALFDLRAKLDLPELLYIGSHGLTWWYRGMDEIPEEVHAYVDLARRAELELGPLLEHPGLRFEDKGVGLAIHYRLAPDEQAARQAILAAIQGSPAAQGFELREGIRVIELYPRIHVNKGTALRRVVERFELSGLLFLGDDLTDVDAMFAAAQIRGDDCRIATIAVRHAESPAIAAEAADWLVEGVAGAEQVLEWLAREVEARISAAEVQSPSS